MSANKSYDTKVPEDENTDSGFLSGKLDEPQLSEELERRDPPGGSDSKNVCESEATDDQQDSGLCVSERLSKLDISDSIYTPIAHEGDEGTKAQELSPEVVLNLLFGQDDDGDTQLHVASVRGCTKSVSVLIRLCPEPVLMDIRNDFGHTALHLAVMSGNTVVTRMLVRAGASIAVRDLKGETPLHIAVAAKNIDCLQALLAPVKELSPQRNRSAILNQKNYQGQTCVHIAAVNGHVEALQILVYYGADINAREGLAGSTALHLAAMRGDERLAWFLMERCAGVRWDARDFAGRSAKRLARRTGAQAAFRHAPDSDSEGDSDSDMYDSDHDSLFDRIRDQINPIDVA